MDQPTFGKRLAAARRLKGFRTQEALADFIGVSSRTIRSYETDKYQPPVETLNALRQALGPFDQDGDPVEVAVLQSDLTEDRQHVVLGVYKRQVREQAEEQEGRRGA